MRLDVYLCKHSLAPSRAKAQEMIASSLILLNHQVCTKNSYEVQETDLVQVCEQKIWVSRAGGKLEGFLQDVEVQIEGKRVLDIGSSTGGFSEVLLERGASEIVCVDVGSNQLHPSLRHHPKIAFFENTDIREFRDEGFELVVCDVSFISLRLIFQSIFTLTLKDCILLFKPQFEVGREAKRDKKGVIKDLKVIEDSLRDFVAWIEGFGAKILEVKKSKIKGKCGNEEYFIYWKKS
ncbi:TlyA family RNA methyltransferase [uncultured Helicobacter sp.]|uniref:23S rRNA (cytidine-2'-O)-methyltransferase TlyA n=1 Tax=uncultured Helicobacter sp. TaxID=175537 RepID=UPI0026379949|nr:TlyA family RNA methyltransferase [uncultured Helicobacter sp.]